VTAPVAFLQNLKARTATLPDAQFHSPRLFVGPGDSGLEVLVVAPAGKLSVPAVRSLWKKYLERDLVARHDDRHAFGGGRGRLRAPRV
jgi:hypothetical protein